MNKNKLKPFSIGKIVKRGYPFFVDSYQRGYRWGSEEVMALLNDIHDFSLNSESTDIYWLQPIIVVKRIIKGKEYMELIDGQQRMTTIYLILCFLEQNRYEMVYKTRTSTETFFKEIAHFKEYDSWPNFCSVMPQFDKIDNYHIFTAYKTIESWFKKHSEYQRLFLFNLLRNTRVIWYQIGAIEQGSNEAEKIFRRINVGKIPLTNSELIKAQVLISQKDDAARGVAAEKWDRIEYGLHDKRLWAFANKYKNDTPTRIELLLDLVSKKNESQKAREEKLHTYLYFSQAANLSDEWVKVEEYFNLLCEWYDSPNLYHHIGYLIEIGCPLYKVIGLYRDKKKGHKATKSSFEKDIRGLLEKEFEKTDISALSYEHHYREVYKVLLFFNIQTTLSLYPYNYFPFDLLKAKNWSLEHIHAQKQKKITDREVKKRWLVENKTNIIKLFTELTTDQLDIIKEIDKLMLVDNPDIEQVTESVFNLFGRTEKDKIHGISNLALLDGVTNSKLNNSVFPHKRMLILQTEQQEGNFIPVATRNVFLKYYSGNISHMHYWDPLDQDQYYTAIEQCINNFKVKSN
jgi:hypothetical protein